MYVLQVLQDLTRQLLAERAERAELCAERAELKDMLEQEDRELEAALAAKQDLEEQLQHEVEKVGASPRSRLTLLHLSCIIAAA